MSEVDTPLVSIVIPVYQEEENVQVLCARLLPVVRALDAAAEVIFVDDGSRDATLALLLAERRTSPEIVIRSFARNFGQHAAVLAGFDAARGKHVVTLDADLQNPPEEIPRIVAQLQAGYDLVGTIRQDRQDSWFRRRASRIVNAMTRRASGIQLHDFGCMLRGYSREIAKTLAARGESHTFIPALAYVYAKNPIEIPVAHAARDHGDSKYSLLRLFRLQLDLLTGFSQAPMRLLFSMGGVVALAGVLLGLVLFAMRLFHGPEWAADGVFTLFAILFVFVGAQFFALGLIGEYVGRTLGVVRQRPTFILRDLPDDGADVVDEAPAAEGRSIPAREAIA